MLYIQKEIQFWETDAPLPDSYKVGTMEDLLPFVLICLTSLTS